MPGYCRFTCCTVVICAACPVLPTLRQWRAISRDQLSPEPKRDSSARTGSRLAVLRAFAQRRPDDDLIWWRLGSKPLLKAAQQDEVLKGQMQEYAPELLKEQSAADKPNSD